MTAINTRARLFLRQAHWQADAAMYPLREQHAAANHEKNAGGQFS